MVWQDVVPRVNIAFKITNWCNLCCAHCMERSSIKEPFNLMPIAQIENYIAQYVNMGVPVWDYVVFTGGESMAPYYIGQGKYIRTLAELCAKNNVSPCFKTNAMWGKRLLLCDSVLKDLADVAHKYDRQVLLDISIDEYHDNFLPAANVVSQIMNSQYLIDAIPVSFVGLNTVASQCKFQEFLDVLKSYGISVDAQTTPADEFMITKGDKANVMFYDVGGLTRLGRAADNNIVTARPASGVEHSGGSDCLEITNNNQAILNYKYKTTMDNKTVGEAYNELLQKKR